MEFSLRNTIGTLIIIKGLFQYYPLRWTGNMKTYLKEPVNIMLYASPEKINEPYKHGTS